MEKSLTRRDPLFHAIWEKAKEKNPKVARALHPDFKRRYRRIFSLKEVGIKVPEFQERIEAQEEIEGDENE